MDVIQSIIETTNQCVAAIPTPALWQTTDGLVRECSESMLDLLECQNKNVVINKDISHWPSSLSEWVEGLHTAHQKVLSTKEPYSVDIQPPKSMSRIHHSINITSKPIGTDTEIIGILSLISPTLRTDLFDLEELIGLMPGHVYWKSRDGVYLGCNDNMAKLIGLKSRKTYVGKTLYDFAPKKIADEITMIDEEIMSGKEEIITQEEAFDVSGNSAIYTTRKVPILSPKTNETIGLVGISIDITQIKEQEKALIQAKEKAEAGERAKTEFIRNISHDLRTPFSGILTVVEFLISQQKDEQEKELLTMIHESSANLIHLLNELIDIASSEQAAAKSNLTNLPKLLSSVIQIYQPALHQKHLTYEILCDERVPTSVITDEKYLRRIILNLVGNAVKFTETGSITLTLNTRTVGKEQYIAIGVKDTGIGIPKNKQSKVFEQFTKLEHSYSGKHQGNGLGLWLVSNMVKSLNGKIELESEVGKGSVFTIVIPMRNDSPEQSS